MASEAAQKGLDVEGDNPDVFGALGMIHELRGEMDDAIAMCEKSVELSPSHADASAFLAAALMESGNLKEGLERMKTAMRLSPICPHWYFWQLAYCHREMGQYDLAVSAWEKAIEQEPNSSEPRIWLADSLVLADRIEEAKIVAQELLKMQPTFSVQGMLREAQYDEARRARIIKNLRAAGLPD